MIKAPTIGSHGLHKTIGCPSLVVLGHINNKYNEYSQEATITITSLRTPIGLKIDLYVGSNAIAMGITSFSWSRVVELMVIALIVSPKYNRVLGWKFTLTHIVTTRFPRSGYFGGNPNIISKIWPTTLMVWLFFFFIFGCFLQISLVILVYMGMSLISYSKGIFRQNFLNFDSKSYSTGD